jgi:recombination protein RecT
MNAQSQAVTAEQSKASPATLQSELDVLKPQLEKVLPAHVSPEKFMRVVMTAIAQTPALRDQDCRRSLLTSCVKCATDGLMPDGREAALVLFKTKDGPAVQYMPMVGGILKKVRNSGELLSISSTVVQEKDHFRHWIDDAGEHITFEANLKDADRGPLLCVFAIAKTKDGGVYVEVMSRSQIEQVRQVSRAKDNGPWGPWYSEMARKTVIRRLSKRLPMSTDLETVIHRDDELYELNQQRLTAPSGRDAAKAALGLPILPDADDAAAAADGAPEGVDRETGEVIENPPAREKGTPLPGFDEKKAVKLLRGTKDRAALDGAMDGIRTMLNGAETPVAVKSAYEEQQEKLADQQK